MRVVGFDTLERPCLYTCFGQANDRFDPDKNVRSGTIFPLTPQTLLLDASTFALGRHVMYALEETTRYLREHNKRSPNHVETWVLGTSLNSDAGVRIELIDAELLQLYSFMVSDVKACMHACIL